MWGGFKLRRSYLLLLFNLLFLLLIGCGAKESQEILADQQEKGDQTVQNQQSQNSNYSNQTGKSKEKTIEYRNEEYGFSLRLPESWEGKYEVERKDLGQEEETIFVFTYKPEKVELFSVTVLNISKEKWNNEYAGGLLEYMGEKDGRIFAYSIPTEISDQLAGNKKEKLHALVDVTHMVNVDVPRIVQTFELLN